MTGGLRLSLQCDGERLESVVMEDALPAQILEFEKTEIGPCTLYRGELEILAAGLQTGRRFIGIEIEPAHDAVACRRIAAAWLACQP